MLRAAIGAAALAFGLALTEASPARAEYPERPVTIMVPLAAGSGMDVLVRLYADRLSQSLGKPVIVENRPGASLMLAANTVANAAPDGHTLLVSTSSAMAINLTLFRQVTYDPERDFTPISLYVKSPFILVVNPDLPAKSVPELIAYAKANQGKLSYSSPGAGVAQHLSMEYMKNQFGLEITHVPYRATPQSIQDIAAGHVAMGWAEAGASIPLIRDGKLRALAVSSATRLPLLPDVPPFAEAAPAPGFEAVSWHMLLAPAKTPKHIVDRLHAEMKRALADSELKQKIEAIGLIPLDTPSVEDLRVYRRAEQEKWGALVKKLGLEGTQ
jgi:tripartite-type tricarboxylate transporter receptor subunit TctC